jgi:hypothetical protein
MGYVRTGYGVCSEECAKARVLADGTSINNQSAEGWALEQFGSGD